MNSSTITEVLLLVGLLFLSSFFSSAETSLVAVSKIRIRTLADQGNKRAKTVLKIFKNEPKMLSAILIGNNLVNTFMASLSSMIAYRFGGYAVSIATFLITFLILVFGEITPKTLATRSPEKFALLYAPIILCLMNLLTPIIWFINLFSNMILRLFGVGKESKNAAITESELHTILDVSHEEGVIETEERDMIRNVFDFTDAKASQIMVPRVHVTSIDVNTSREELEKIYKRDHYTRLPVYEGNPDNIIGIINMKDLVFSNPEEPWDLRQLLRKPYFTIENKGINELLSEMQKDQYNLTVVLDEYGELAGILTIEDIIEEIIGEVQDEFDASENENIQQVGPSQYKVKGYLSLHDLNDELDLDLESEDYDSIGGLVIEKLNRFPTLGESVKLDNGVIVRVISLHKNRIEQVILDIPPKEEKKEDDDKDDDPREHRLRLDLKKDKAKEEPLEANSSSDQKKSDSQDQSSI